MSRSKAQNKCDDYIETNCDDCSGESGGDNIPKLCKLGGVIHHHKYVSCHYISNRVPHAHLTGEGLDLGVGGYRLGVVLF